MNMCTKISAHWNIIRCRSGFTFVFVTDSQIFLSIVQKVWKAYKKNFRSIGGKYLWKFVYHNTSFGRIKIQDSLISYENWIEKRHQSRRTYAHIFYESWDRVNIFEISLLPNYKYNTQFICEAYWCNKIRTRWKWLWNIFLSHKRWRSYQ